MLPQSSIIILEIEVMINIDIALEVFRAFPVSPKYLELTLVIKVIFRPFGKTSTDLNIETLQRREKIRIQITPISI